MDDSTSKPIDPAAMQAALARGGSNDPAGVWATVSVSSLPVLDPAQIAQLQQLCRPDGKSIAGEIAALFVREMPGRLRTMSELMTDCRGAELRRAAHTLAGSCASLGAKRMRGLVADLEAAAGEGAWARVSVCFVSIQSAHCELQEELRRLKLIS